ncbi:MAG TPA: hypothetical protein VK582_22660 [Pyrinomonadaceae bacterium]|nr:hypothetical protein [Pyrinomonadaceae bacterium]
MKFLKSIIMASRKGREEYQLGEPILAEKRKPVTGAIFLAE